jgi:hypothetical protein
MQLWQPAGTLVQPSPVSHSGEGQLTDSQACRPVQFTSQAHDVLHDTPLHELLPEHVTSQGPSPHTMLSQVFVDEHDT